MAVLNGFTNVQLLLVEVQVKDFGILVVTLPLPLTLTRVVELMLSTTLPV